VAVLTRGPGSAAEGIEKIEALEWNASALNQAPCRVLWSSKASVTQSHSIFNSNKQYIFLPL